MPALSASDIELAQASFERLAPNARQFTFEFYRRLFAIDPTLRPMFRPNLESQADRLLAVLAYVVSNLDDVESLLRTGRELGARHVVYGVKDAHYETVGCALIETLDAMLGKHFTPAVERTWSKIFETVSQAMIAGANESCGYAA
ncbi:MAG: globin domain-containing protein [Pseudomonadota bacterium]